MHFTSTNTYIMYNININRWREEMVKEGHRNSTQWMMYLKMELDSLKQVLVGQSQTITVNKLSELQMQEQWSHWQNQQVLYDAPHSLDAKTKSLKSKCEWFSSFIAPIKDQLLCSSYQKNKICSAIVKIIYTNDMNI